MGMGWLINRKHSAGLCRGVTCLQVGGLGLMGILVAAAARIGGASGESQRIATWPTACVLIFLNGGPSHLDMWDMKPDAPPGIRGEFQLRLPNARRLFPLGAPSPGWPSICILATVVR